MTVPMLLASGLVLGACYVIAKAIATGTMTAVTLEAIAARAEWAVRAAVALATPDRRERIEEQSRELLARLKKDQAPAARVVYEMSTMLWAGIRTRSPYRATRTVVFGVASDLRHRRYSIVTYTIVAWPLGALAMLGTTWLLVLFGGADPSLLTMTAIVTVVGIPTTALVESLPDGMRYRRQFGSGAGWIMAVAIASSSLRHNWVLGVLPMAGAISVQMCIRTLVHRVLLRQTTQRQDLASPA